MKQNRYIAFLFLLLFFFSFWHTAEAQRQKLQVGAKKMKGLKGGGREFLGGFQFKYISSGIHGTANYAKNTADGNYDIKGNVVVNLKNGAVVNSDKLFYDGKKFRFRENVELINQGKTLYTQFLDFDPKDNSGFFYNGGKVVDSTSTLESRKGYYYPDRNYYIFVDKVVITDKDYMLYSDTLKYELDTQKATVYSPTHVFGDSTYLYCEAGWYNTSTEKAEFTKNSFIRTEKHILKGDTLQYDQISGIGNAYGNVEIEDTTEHIIITGDEALYLKKTEDAYVTKNVLMMQLAEKDTLFLHADTLHSAYDTTQTYQIIRAYHRVKIFRNDLQAKCDSLAYTLQDSVIHFYHNPVLWTGYNQLTAQSMKLYTKNGNPDYLQMSNSAFIISQEDTVIYNQVKGDAMKGYFRNKELYRIDVKENVESIYFPRDNEFYIGVNRLEGNKMQINLRRQRVKEILMLSKATGSLDPMDLITGENLYLTDFEWLNKIRPKKWTDIFVDVKN